MSRKRCILALGAAFLAASCSSSDQLRTVSPLYGLGGLARDRYASGKPGTEEPVYFSIASTFTSEQVDALEAPTMAGYSPARDAWTALTLAGSNRGFDTYFTPGQTGVTVRDGIVVSTRGRGGDLHSFSADPTRLAMSAGNRIYTCSLRYLTPLTKIEARPATCAMRAEGAETETIVRRSFPTTGFVGSCTGETVGSRNIHWRDTRNGHVIRSRQRISGALARRVLTILLDESTLSVFHAPR